MPTPSDIRTILILGPGPTVIGQGGELDALGYAACRAFKDEGLRLVVLCPNPATAMTGPALADRTYVEPLTVAVVEQVMDAERPDALVPFLGGQTAIGLAYLLERDGVLARRGVPLLGLSPATIRAVGDGHGFKEAMAGEVPTPESGVAATVEEAAALANRLGFPVVVRPALTVGRTASVFNREELEPEVKKALVVSPAGQALVERSMAGWKALSVHALRDASGRARALVMAEGVEPLGINMGDAPVVVPPQTIGPAALARCGELAARVLERIGLVGIAEVHFAVHPKTEDAVVLNVSCHLSRGTALAARATGLPIARIAALLSLGRSLTDLALPDEPTRPGTVVVRVPRFTYETFPAANRRLTTSMKSVGEAIGVGGGFPEALQRGLRALDGQARDLGYAPGTPETPAGRLKDALRTPSGTRLHLVRQAFDAGMTTPEVRDLTGIDERFLEGIRSVTEMAARLARHEGKDALAAMDPELLRSAKRLGFSDSQISNLTKTDSKVVRQARKRLNMLPNYSKIAPSGSAFAPTFDGPDEREAAPGRTVLVLSGGPSRIGQGAELDVIAAEIGSALRERGIRVALACPNPASVAADPAFRDALYVVPLAREEVLDLIDVIEPEGVIVQAGGLTARALAADLAEAGVPILGTDADAIDRAEDHARMSKLARSLGFLRPDDGVARDRQEARAAARRIGYPVVTRLLYAAGGRAMAISFTDADLDAFLDHALPAKGDSPILLDRFLDYATEVDVDAVSDGANVLLGGILEHIEEAGVHSGDSACVLPPHTLAPRIIDEVGRMTRAIAQALPARGFLNVQFAIKGDDVYVLGIAPRASLTVPLVERATGLPLAMWAARAMLGESLADVAANPPAPPAHVAVKEVVFPFVRFPGVDTILGPEMKSTGEVMGIDAAYGSAFMKAQIAAGQTLPTSGTVFFSLKDADKRMLVPLAKKFVDLGFRLLATRGTADVLARNGVPCETVRKVSEGRPHVADRIVNREIDLLINTPSGRAPKGDEVSIRHRAYAYGVPLVTTMSGAFAVADAIEALQKKGLAVRALQEYHAEERATNRRRTEP